MSEKSIIPFLYEGERMVRAVFHGDEQLWVARDWAAMLHYRDTKKAIAAHCKHGRPVAKGGESPPLGLHPETVIIPEGDVWRLIIRSNLPEAQRIEAWLMDEVLPTLRRTGQYSMPAASESEDPEDVAGLPMGTKITLVNCIRHTFGERAAQQMTFKARLPVVPAMEEALRQHPDLFQASIARAPGSETVTPAMLNGGQH